MKTIHRKRRGFTLIELLVVIAIIATLAGIGVPMIINQQKKGARTEATANAKQIGLALFAFDQDYGSYPSDATAATITTNGEDKGLTLTGTYSNDYLRQLIATDTITSERNFFAKGAKIIKPDNAMEAGKALAKGEVGFAYIMENATDSLSSSSNAGRALLVSSILDKAAQTFDPDVYDKKAIVLRIDSSATSESIRTDKKCLVGGGKTLFDSGAGTVWDTVTPDIKEPEK